MASRTTLVRLVLALIAWPCLWGAWCLAMMPAASADAATFRCEAGGRITYADQPCVDGTSRILAEVPRPSIAESAAARERARHDQRALADLERERSAQQRGDREDARRAARVAAEHERQRRACLRLALKAKRAREDQELAAPRDLSKRQAASRRANDEHATLCGARAG